MTVSLTAAEDAEVTFISGVDAQGDIAPVSYQAWNRDEPATYSTTRSSAAKWGAPTAGTAGGVVTYSFDPASGWTASEEAAFVQTLALWSAEANISFQEVGSGGQIQINRGSGSDNSQTNYNYFGSGTIGSASLGQMSVAHVQINTSLPEESPLDAGFGIGGGYPWQVLLHEEGHALGLGHAGGYNGSVNAATEQYSQYDSRVWSIMSYINPDNAAQAYYASEPVQGHDWGSTTQPGTTDYDYNLSVTPMPMDILAIQRLYGAPVSTPLSGGVTFGFDCTIQGVIRPFFDFTQNTRPIVTLWAQGGGNSLDLSGYSTSSTVDLHAGAFSSCAGLTDNVAIGFGVAVDRAVGGSANDELIANDDGDMLDGGGGSNSILGGAGVDTAVFDGSLAASNVGITHGLDGYWTVSTSLGTDLAANVERLQFTDVSLSLYAKDALLGHWRSDVVLRDSGSGGIVAGEVDGDHLEYLQVSGLGAEWTVEGFARLHFGIDDMIAESTSGAVVAGEFSGASLVYHQIAALGPDWTILGSGAFLSYGDALLLRNTNGAIALGGEVGQDMIGFVQIAAIGSDWTFEGIGDYLDDGRPQVLFENANGAVALGERPDQTLLFTQVGALGSDWSFRETGDFLGDGHDDFLIQNANGVLAVGEVSGGQTTYTTIGALGPEWSFVGAGDYSAAGFSSFMIRDTAGDIVVGTVANGQAHYATVGSLGSNWAFQG